MNCKNLVKLILFIGIFSCLYLPASLWGQCGNGSFKVLHYTETSGYNHNTRSQSLSMFQSIGNANNFTVVNDENGNEFNSLSNLQQYAVVIFSNTSGDNILDANQRSNFEAYIRGGGSYVGIHAASDTYRHSSANGNRTGTWDWYAENVAGCSVQESPNHTSSNHNNDMTHQLAGHPTLGGLPSPWNKTEEYYYWQNGYLNNSFTEILRVNRTGGASYDGARMTTHIKSLSWGGRAFYTSLGHAQSNFSNDQNFKNLLTNAVNWTASPNVGGGGGGLSITGTPKDASCGRNDGSIDISVTGGSGNYTYSWSNNATSQDINNLNAGSYTVQVDDGNGCRDNETFAVGSSGTKPVLSLKIDQEISCFGANDGAISSTVLGSNGPYAYLWKSGETSANLTGKRAGSYELVVTNPAGCKDTASVNLQEPQALQVSVQIITSPSCTNPGGGEIRATGSGGTGRLTYRWNTGATTATISGLSNGQYTVTVTDSRGCTNSDTHTFNVNSYTLTLRETEKISCFGFAEGEITATVSGGQGPFSYSWNNGQTSAIASGLGAGMQVLTVSDRSGCSVKDSLELLQPDTLRVQVSILDEISCYGASDANILGTPTGGTAPYTYRWSTNDRSPQLNGIGSGSYGLVLNDSEGCIALDSIALLEPDSLRLTLQEKDPVSCNGLRDGSISSLISGGKRPYSYKWSSGQTSPDIAGIGAGTYTLELTDANNCQIRMSITLTEPDAIIGILKIDKDLSCFGGRDGEMSVSVSGGMPRYSYFWKSGSTGPAASGLREGFESLTIRDSQGCTWTDSLELRQPTALLLSASMTVAATCNGAANGEALVQASGASAPYSYLWSNGQTTATATGLAAGTYTVRVQDVNGCEASTTVSISNYIPWTLSLTERNSISCYGDSTGAISAQIQNGTGSAPFTYLWSTNEIGVNITNVTAGTYSLTVTDNDGCEASENLVLN